MAQAYVEDGFDVVCMNFRGCCGQPNDTIGGYHLGFTDDLKHFLKMISKMVEQDYFEQRPVYLSGFSLGANVVIKTLGELGDAAMTLYNVQGAAGKLLWTNQCLLLRWTGLCFLLSCDTFLT